MANPNPILPNPKKEVDWKKVDSMGRIKCTAAEVCEVLEISHDTLNRACKEKHEMTAQEYLAMKGLGGNASLRRSLYSAAMKENPTILKFLATSPAWLNMQVNPEVVITEGRSKFILEMQQDLDKSRNES